MPGSRLLLAEREEIRVGIGRDESLSDIARRLGRYPSTVCREVAANGGREGYRAVAAQERAERLAQRPQPPKLVADPDLAERVQDLFASTRYTPRTVAHLLRQEGWEVSAETLYRACYQPGRASRRATSDFFVPEPTNRTASRRRSNSEPKASTEPTSTFQID